MNFSISNTSTSIHVHSKEEIHGYYACVYQGKDQVISEKCEPFNGYSKDHFKLEWNLPEVLEGDCYYKVIGFVRAGQEGNEATAVCSCEGFASDLLGTQHLSLR